MSSRQGRKAAVREARLERERARRARDIRAHATRRRRRVFGGAAVAAAVAVTVVIAVSGGHGNANAALGGRVNGGSFSHGLFAGIPQHGTVLGRPDAPVRIVEFADLQCPYCQEYTAQALPQLVRDYVRTGRAQMQFENLSFIGPDSVRAGHVAAAAAAQNKLWDFVDLLYLNQGAENTGYATPAYLQRVLQAIPGLNVAAALRASATPAADAALADATNAAAQDGINGTPSFLIGRRSGPLRPFQPQSLSAGPFETAVRSLMRGSG
jgi:predicted DsbA family dithiol-disulfide isomerase